LLENEFFQHLFLRQKATVVRIDPIIPFRLLLASPPMKKSCISGSASKDTQLGMASGPATKTMGQASVIGMEPISMNCKDDRLSQCNVSYSVFLLTSQAKALWQSGGKPHEWMRSPHPVVTLMRKAMSH
uniref:Uncharacterized protein n=1 Tax=Romanomermis culicivorax TaxID=13658 RepID=A0A915J9P6_ROMCU